MQNFHHTSLLELSSHHSLLRRATKVSKQNDDSSRCEWIWIKHFPPAKRRGQDNTKNFHILRPAWFGIRGSQPAVAPAWFANSTQQQTERARSHLNSEAEARQDAYKLFRLGVRFRFSISFRLGRSRTPVGGWQNQHRTTPVNNAFRAWWVGIGMMGCGRLCKEIVETSKLLCTVQSMFEMNFARKKFYKFSWTSAELKYILVPTFRIRIWICVDYYQILEDHAWKEEELFRINIVHVNKNRESKGSL